MTVTIDTIQGSVSSMLADLQADASAAVNRLSDAAATWSMTTLAAVANLSIPTMPTYAGAKPALGTITLPTFTAADFTGLQPSALPVAPGTPASTPLWSEAFWGDLKSRLDVAIGGITNSDDLDTLISKLTSETGKMQVALYQKEHARKQQALRDLYAAAEANTGARGFNFPNSMTTALKIDAQQKFQFGLDEASKTLVEKLFDWAKSSYQFTVQESISAHNADVEFNSRYADAVVKTYSATVSGLIEAYSAEVRGVVAQAEARIREYAEQAQIAVEVQKTLKEIQRADQLLDVEIVKANAGISEAEWELRVKDFSERVDSFIKTATANMQILDENVKNRIASAKAVVDGYAALGQNVSQIVIGSLNAA